MKNRILPYFFIVFSLAGCSMGLSEDMKRKASDPENIAPCVSSFKDANTVYVSWDEDKNADEYALYRALDDDRNFTLVYQGTDLSYTDTDILTENRYLYTLYKIRGSKRFGPSPSAMGIGSSTIQDNYEPNDSYDTATVFTYDLYSNVYCYKSIGTEHTIIDRDYYCVSVKPHMTASYSVGITGLASGSSTDLNIQRKYYAAEDIINYHAIAFDNPTSSTAIFYFAIFIDENNIGAGGGNLTGYEFEYLGEVPSGTGD